MKSGVGNGESLLLYTRTFAQSVVVAVLCDDIPPGVIVLSEHQRKNLEVTIGDTFPFSVYTDPCGVLSDVTVSIMPRFVPKADTELDGVALARAVKQFLFRVSSFFTASPPAHTRWHLLVVVRNHVVAKSSCMMPRPSSLLATCGCCAVPRCAAVVVVRLL